MKKLVCLLLAAVLCLMFPGCEKPNKNEALIQEEIDEIKDSWEDYYEERDIHSDYLEIKNTRILFLEEDAAEIWDGFADIVCIVEFELYSELYGPDAYPVNAKYMDSVLVYADGDLEVSSMNLLQIYRSVTYSVDFTDILDSIEDYGSRYNQIFDLDE